MNYRDKLYKSYVTNQTKPLYGGTTLSGIRKQFPIWNSYYGSTLPKEKKATILDIACGDGGIVYWLQECGYINASGIDISQEQINLAQSLHIKNTQRADLVSYLSEKKSAYHAIFALDIFEHFTKEELWSVLEQIHDALKPGGVLIIKTPNAEGVFGARLRYADFTHETAFTESSLREVLLATGFREIAFKEAGPVPHGMISIIRTLLWRTIRLTTNLHLLVETGQTANILTQNIIASAKK